MQIESTGNKKYEFLKTNGAILKSLSPRDFFFNGILVDKMVEDFERKLPKEFGFSAKEEIRFSRLSESWFA